VSRRLKEHLPECRTMCASSLEPASTIVRTLFGAILEGVAFSSATPSLCLLKCKCQSVACVLAVDGARSPFWRQDQADVYGRTVEMSKPKRRSHTVPRSSPDWRWTLAHR